jgi:hypothetical protein
MDWFVLAQDREPLEVSCEHGNESSGFTEYWEILHWLYTWPLLKNGVGPLTWFVR